MQKTDLAVERYVKEEVSLGKAAAIAGVSYDKMLEILYSRGIKPKFEPASRKEMKKELKKIRHMLE